jgi:hypothetical protein
MQNLNNRNQLRTGLLAAGLVSLCALMLLMASGMQTVNMGLGGNAWQTVWLLEFNWVVALTLWLTAGAGLLGSLWLCWGESRARK